MRLNEQDGARPGPPPPAAAGMGGCSPGRAGSCRMTKGAHARSPQNGAVAKENRMALMAGKQGLIMGVANERSIAWGIAKALHAQGARLAFTYQGDAPGKRGRPFAESLESRFVLEADVGSG